MPAKSGFQLQLYGRLMVCCMLVILLVTFTFAFFVTKYYTELETVKQLEQSRNALNAICDYYNQKQELLPELILPMYQVDRSDISLEDMLRSPTDAAFHNPVGKANLVDILEKIVAQDGDIKEILLYQKSTGSTYAYLRESRTIETVGVENPFLDHLATHTYNRITTGSRANGAAGYEITYGIGGIIGMDKNAGIAGTFLITFNTQALERVLDGFRGTLGRFVLVTAEGDTIYDSQADYQSKKTTSMEAVLGGKTSVSIDGKPYYVQTATVGKSDVLGVNLVPKEAIGDQKILLVVYGTFACMAILCVELYILSGHLMRRRIKALENAMALVGSNNLSYRIPVGKPSDEFEKMSSTFNEMCDELQQTIKREYIVKVKKRKAELGSLQAGINPHFLFNTLEAIRVMASDSSEEVSGMIVNLANLYRVIVRDQTFIPIRNEVNICEMYIDIFSLRYRNALEYEVRVEDRLMGFGILKNLLQPIIENYFVHGIKSELFENRFTIEGFLKNGCIYFVLEDNGRGLSKTNLCQARREIEEAEQEVKPMYGLANIQKRIRLIYGAPYGITIESEENVRTCVTVMIKAMSCSQLEDCLDCLEDEPNGG